MDQDNIIKEEQDNCDGSSNIQENGTILYENAEGIDPFEPECIVQIKDECDFDINEENSAETVNEIHLSKQNFNMSKSAKEIYEASLGISNAIVNETKKIESKNKDQDMSFQNIKVEQISVDVDPLLVHEIKEETFEENEVTPTQHLTSVYIKQE